MSESEYFALLEQSPERVEWINGEVRVRASSSVKHATIATRFASAINMRLNSESFCEAVCVDLKIRAEAANANYFPDVVLYKDDALFDDSRPHCLLTPLLIAEVLSHSTMRIDREEKLLNYRQIPSLRQYLLISQHRVLIEHYHLDEHNQWISELYNRREQEIYIDFLDVQIPVEEIYRRLNIPEGIIVVSEEVTSSD